MRAAYGIALISGIVLKVTHIAAVAVGHKVFAAAFVVLLVALLIFKLAFKKQK